MYTCEHMYVCKEVLSASTRRGTDICEFAQHGFTYKSICDMIYVYFWVYACIQRGSNCEHSQGHKHMWVRTTRVHIQNYSWYEICILILVNICMQRGSKCEHSQGHKQVWERTARVDIPTYPWYDSWYMYTCEYMYVYNNVLGVSTRKGTNICQLAQHGFIYKSICDGIYVYLRALARAQTYMWVRTTWVHIQNDTWYDVCILILLNICMQRGSKCEHSQGHKQVWECTARVDIPTYPWYDSWYMYTCEYMYMYTMTF